VFVLVLLVTGLVLLFGPVQAHAAPVQDEPTTTSPTFGSNPEAPEQHIIPRPNSGTPPQDAGDRGGALQFVVLGAIVVGVSLVVTLAIRESRRNRAAKARQGSVGAGAHDAREVEDDDQRDEGEQERDDERAGAAPPGRR
jgi:hypothetical protein